MACFSVRMGRLSPGQEPMKHFAAAQDIAAEECSWASRSPIGRPGGPRSPTQSAPGRSTPGPHSVTSTQSCAYQRALRSLPGRPRDESPLDSLVAARTALDVLSAEGVSAEQILWLAPGPSRSWRTHEWLRFQPIYAAFDGFPGEVARTFTVNRAAPIRGRTHDHVSASVAFQGPTHGW
jgi:hypothetical protein